MRPIPLKRLTRRAREYAQSIELPDIDSKESAVAHLETLPDRWIVFAGWLCGCSALHILEHTLPSDQRHRQILDELRCWLLSGDASLWRLMNPGRSEESRLALTDAMQAAKRGFDSGRIAAYGGHGAFAAGHAVTSVSWAIMRGALREQLPSAAAATCSQLAAACAFDDRDYPSIASTPNRPYAWSIPERIVHAVTRHWLARQWTAQMLRQARRLGFRGGASLEDQEVAADFVEERVGLRPTYS